MAAWDVWALRGGHRTLSSAYAHAAHSRVGRVPVAVAVVYLVRHLEAWPSRFARVDPLRAAAGGLGDGIRYTVCTKVQSRL